MEVSTVITVYGVLALVGILVIVYFGLMPEFIGQGLGGVLLSSAIRRASTSDSA